MADDANECAQEEFLLVPDLIAPVFEHLSLTPVYLKASNGTDHL